MTEVSVTFSTAVVDVTSATSAEINVEGADEAVINENQATIATTLTDVNSIQTPAWIQWNTTAVPTPAVGRVWWNDTDGTLDLGMKGGNVVQQIGQELFAYVKSSNGGARNEGQAVYITGSDGTNKLVALAQANTEPTSSKTFAIMTESISGGSKGFCTTFGLVRNLDTNHLVEGGPVWLSATTPGNLTATRPTTPDHAVFVGFCVRKNKNNGVIFVNIQNGYELDELHNVKITDPQNGQVLKYYAAGGYWRNENV